MHASQQPYVPKRPPASASAAAATSATTPSRPYTNSTFGAGGSAAMAVMPLTLAMLLTARILARIHRTENPPPTSMPSLSGSGSGRPPTGGYANSRLHHHSGHGSHAAHTGHAAHSSHPRSHSPHRESSSNFNAQSRDHHQHIRDRDRDRDGYAHSDAKWDGDAQSPSKTFLSTSASRTSYMANAAKSPFKYSRDLLLSLFDPALPRPKDFDVERGCFVEEAREPLAHLPLSDTEKKLLSMATINSDATRRGAHRPDGTKPPRAQGENVNGNVSTNRTPKGPRRENYVPEDTPDSLAQDTQNPDDLWDTPTTLGGFAGGVFGDTQKPVMDITASLADVGLEGHDLLAKPSLRAKFEDAARTSASSPLPDVKQPIRSAFDSFPVSTAAPGSISLGPHDRASDVFGF
eukprot:jgi/Hompol1/5444/HPOL_001695-RA